MFDALKARLFGAPKTADDIPAGAQRQGFEVWLARKLFSISDRVALYKEIVSLMEAGVPYVAAMTQYRNGLAYVLSPGDHRVIFLDHVLHEIFGAATFAQAVDGWVSESERVLIEAGERGGDLVQALKNAGKTAVAASKIRSALWAALAAPMLDLIILIATVVYVGVSFVPELARSSNPQTWTGSVRWLWLISDFTTHWGLLLAGVLIGAVVWSLWSLPGRGVVFRGRTLIPAPIGRVRDRLDKFVPWSIYRDMQAAGMLVSFGVMLGTGIPVNDALLRLQRAAEPYLRDKLRRMISAQVQSLPDQDVWNVGLLPPEKAVAIAIFSKTPDFKTAVEDMGDAIVDATLKSIEAKVGRIATYLRLTVAGYTAFLFIAISQLQTVLVK